MTELRSRILASEERFWDARDLGGDAAANRVLAELSRAGQLRRIRRGLYWRGRATRHTLADGTVLRTYPTEHQVLERVLGDLDGVGYADWTAANRLGVTTQVPARTFIAVPARPPAQFRPYVFRDRRGRHARLASGASHTEVSILEALRVWHHVADYPNCIDTVAGIITEHCDPGRLASAARTEPAVVQHRLAVLLEHAGHDSGLSLSSEERSRAERDLTPDCG